MESTALASPSAAPAAQLDRRTLLLIALCSMTYFLDCLIPALMGPLAAPIAGSLGLGPAELGAVFSANLVGQCLGLVLVPLAARRLGHRRIILWTTLGFGLAEMLTALVGSRDALVASRLVTGFFLGGALPSGLAAVTQASPANRRGLATMLLFTAYGLGGAVSGVLASQFLDNDQWRQAFVYTGGACLVVAALAWRWLEEPGYEHEPPPPADSPARRGQGAAAILTPPLLGGTLLLWLMFTCALTIYYCLSSWLPSLLVEVGRSPRLAAYAISSYTSGGVISGLLIGPLIDRFGARPILGSFIGMAAVLLFLIGSLMDSLSDWPLLVLLASCGFFMLGAYGGINVVLSAWYPADLRAIGIGWTKSVSRLGTVLPPIAIGVALSQGIRPATLVSLFALPAALMLMSLACMRKNRT